MRRRARLRGWERAVGPVSLLAGAIAWEAIGQALDVSVFPPLSAVLGRLGELLADGTILGYLATSVTNLAIGFAVALVFGLTLGVLMGVYRRVEMALDIYVRAMLTAPSLVFAPIFFTLFGLDRITIVGVIVLYSTFIIVLNTAEAVKTAPRSLVEMARCYGAGDRFVLRRVILPSATPLIMAGVRLGAGRAVKGMINGEMFVAVVGLGGVVMTAGRNFDAETVLAVMTLIIVLAFMVVWLVERLDRRLTAWLPETNRA
ncbi:MAG: ABC transporter permease [Chloroflexi bacterium]|nr:ABC transporter permease [Chloroflexota bacterium]